MKEIAQIANLANSVADTLSRELLDYLLPEEPFRISHLSRPSPDAKAGFFKKIESGIAYISDMSRRTKDWTGMVEERRQQEKALEDTKRARITRAQNMFQRLNFESLIPYYLDYKRRGPEYALIKWSETLPIQKIKVKISTQKQSEPNTIHIPLKKVEEKDKDKP